MALMSNIFSKSHKEMAKCIFKQAQLDIHSAYMPSDVEEWVDLLDCLPLAESPDINLPCCDSKPAECIIVSIRVGSHDS